MTAPPITAPAAARPVRFRHVDGLRGIAALAVMWMHFGDLLRPVSAVAPAYLDFFYAWPVRVNLGRTGVMIFFAISGFVICRSFGGPPEGRERRFLIRRLCRLYPAFWASALAAAGVWWLQGKHVSLRLLASNATMLPSFLGQPRLLGVYWTLEIEILFYGLCLVLHRIGWIDRRKILGALIVLFAVLAGTVQQVSAALHIPLMVVGNAQTAAGSFSLMLWGAVFRLIYEQTGGLSRRLTPRSDILTLLLLGAAVIGLQDSVFIHAIAQGHWTFAPDTTCVALGVLIFGLWVAIAKIDFQPLTYLGVISYSLYLFHTAITFAVVHALELLQARRICAPWPQWTSMLGCAFLSLGLAMVTFHWVEHPAIGLGKRWTARLMPSLVPGDLPDSPNTVAAGVI